MEDRLFLITLYSHIISDAFFCTLCGSPAKSVLPRRKRANMLLTPEERQKYASDPSVVERQLRWIMSR